MSTKVIPAVGLAHGGVYPPLLAMLNETGVTLGKMVEPSFYDFVRQRHMKIPLFMQQFGKLRILKEFARACALRRTAGYRFAFVAKGGPVDGVHWYPDAYTTGDDAPYLTFAVPEGEVEPDTHLSSLNFA